MYTAEISRTNPTAFLFVIDQSGSMDEIMETEQTKARFVADVLNKTLYQLIIRCTRAEGVRDYFDVGVIAYGDSIRSGFAGALAGKILHPLSDVEANPLRIEERVKRVSDGAGGLVDQPTKFPVWFDPTSSGGTPMTAAMRTAAEAIAEWCDSHQNSYPPTIIHVTDGASTDGDPSEIVTALKQMSTNDGECLLFNLHISTAGGQPSVFPSSESGLDEHGRLLFRLSSGFPEHLVQAAREKEYDSVSSESRFFGYKAGYEAIVDFFDIGTRASNLR
ncbi:vWA domain-containing protein [Paracoccus methylarcula]|uniref:VWA domain-containing protein n=1 Tax=Paracoccus methylarcula TaxID=72022 RepID=A0A422QZJ0_9RHOB|nr:vWA domain-containing protein [Paracoccus methylarcula]RNF35330.1 VWA domain-containing protein [Paracoccus methylarcula]